MSPQRFQKIQQVLQHRQPDLTVIMDDVHKPHNLAAIARTCDAVGIGEIHAVTHESLALRESAASGSGKWLQVHTHADIEAAYAVARAQQMQVLVAHFDPQARAFQEIDYTQPTAIVVGAELDGVSQAAVDQADGSILVPMVGMIQSLNVSVATALILFEAYRQRQAAGLYQTCRLEAEHYQRLCFEWSHPDVADYCQRKQLPYPALNEHGDIIEPLARVLPT